MMKRCCFLLFLTLPVSICLGHGVKAVPLETAGARSFQYLYDDGSPMPHCEVKAYSPLDRDTEFLQGATDQKGRFSFLPDIPGTWRVLINDGMGHALSQDIEINEGRTPVGPSNQNPKRIHGLVIGVSIIFGLFGLRSLFLPGKRS